MTIPEALAYELSHRPEPPAKPWTIKDALRWEAERAKRDRAK